MTTLRYERALAMSNAHRDHAHEVLARHVTRWVPSSVLADTQYGVDVVMLRSGEQTAALRIQSQRYLLQYPDSFTQRIRPQDEVRKLTARWYVYGWASEQWQLEFPAPRMLAWVLMDAELLRAEILEGRLKHWREYDNGDGTAFRAYRFGAPFVVARSPRWTPMGEQMQWLP